MIRKCNMMVVDEGLIPETKYDIRKHHFANRDEIDHCKEWIIKYCRRQSAYNLDIWSRSLKGEVENQARIEKREKTYVSNGAFIQAALELGYKAKPSEEYGPNTHFNMKVYLPQDAWKRVRLSTFSRWLFRQTLSTSNIGKLARDAIEDPKWPRKAKRFIDYYLYYLENSCHADVTFLSALKDAWFRCFRTRPPYPDAQTKAKRERFYSGECDVLCYKKSYPAAPRGMTYIYVLFERRKHEMKVRYVGQSRDPATRLRQHILCPGSERRVTWIADLLEKKCYPEMAIIDLVAIKEAVRTESAFIMAFGDFERDFDEPIAKVLLNEYLINEEVCLTV